MKKKIIKFLVWMLFVNIMALIMFFALQDDKDSYMIIVGMNIGGILIVIKDGVDHGIK